MKDFLLICDKNCATYKEVFPLFKQGIVSFGSPVLDNERIYSRILIKTTNPRGK